MERLKQAMERARTERQSVVRPLPTASRAERLRPAMKSTPGKAGIKVEYTRTSKVPVSSKVLRQSRILLTEGLEDTADAYKILRTHVLQRMRATSRKTLAITSPGIGEGKTTTAINLAVSLAREVNQTVLLVDLNLKHPSIAGYFETYQGLGISDYLQKDLELADILFNPGIERLVVLPGREPMLHSSEILSSPRFIDLVNELKHRYEDRLILFDMPPLFAGDDMIAFLPYVDGVVLVVEDKKVTKGELTQASRLLGEKCIGVVLNKADRKTSVSGYY